MSGKFMELTFNLRRLPFATVLAARHYGIDNITAAADAQTGTKLCMAVLRSDNIEVEALLKNGAPVNHHNEPDGWTPLFYSIYYNNHYAFELLLNHGADAAIADYAGRTPLMLAAIRGQLKLINILLSIGVNVRHTDDLGKNAIDFAEEYYQNECSSVLRKHMVHNGESCDE